METFPAREVIKRKSDVAKWAASIGRLGPDVFPMPRCRFRLPASASVFTIGSCFARNIEEHLSLIGCQVPTLDFSVPKNEWRTRPNGILNKYTPAAIFQEISWAHRILTSGGFDPDACDEMRWDIGDGRVVDLQLGGYVPVSEERFLQRRRQVYDLFCKAFDADCVTITLGMTEAWRHKRTGLFIQSAPVSRELLRHADQFEFAVLDYNDCMDFVERTISILEDSNPAVRILITTSPVPMEKTFTEKDVVIANMTSKSTLRSVAARVSDSFDFVDYFPSYEAVVMQDPKITYEEDRLHVKDGVVGRIVSQLIDWYFDAPRSLDRLLQEAASELAEKTGGYEVLPELIAAEPGFNDMSTDQLIVFLRSCWRLRNRRLARDAAVEILSRAERNASHFRAIKHILPRIGCREEAQRYARDVLQQDPSNPLAHELTIGA